MRVFFIYVSLVMISFSCLSLTKTEREQLECEGVYKYIKNHVLNFDFFRILHPECGSGSLDRYFAKQGAFVTCFNSSGSLLNDLRETFKKIHGLQDLPYFRELKKQDQIHILKKLDYFEYDLIILDSMFHDLLETKSLKILQDFLERLMSNTPFLVIRFPPRLEEQSVHPDVWAALNDPQLFFPNMSYLDMSLVEVGNQKTYVISMQGTLVKEKTVKGSLKSYRAKRERTCWIGENKVIKQYLFTRLQPGDLRSQYDRTLAFYTKGHALGFDFLPKLLAKERDEKRGVLVFQKEGRSLIKAYQFLSDKNLKDVAFQVLDILVKLEKHEMTCGDIRGSNFVINEEGKVFVIDYDLASFDSSPDLRDFVMVCWNMTNGFTKYKNSEMTLDRFLRLPLEKFGPLKSFIRPIFEEKVNTLRELKNKI